ncbi:uncharacterized protein LOC134210458 [Armigeres subalbatus]|uniref:uncharacterized protein LOC134210458 n=1 Tax=Armigeres subalbatus TaxID=124917 RepID=UPI002ED1B140
MTISERYTKVKQTGLCFNCLRRGHRTGECNSDRTCKTCKRKHHSLLHENKTTAPQFGVSQSSAVTSSVPEEHCEVAGQAPGSVNCARAATTKQVLLSTAEVEVYGSGNNRLACRALLDSGSDSHLISEAFARKLNIPMERVNIPISGVNNAATRVKHKLHTTISSRVNPFVVDLDFLVVPTITANLPITKVDVRSWIIPDNLALADPSFHTPDEIQMIIGAELFFDLIKTGRMKLAEGTPTLIETQLVLGTRNLHRSISIYASEQAIEEHYERTTSRDESGRYIVKLPFNQNKSQLGDSLETARVRFNRLLRSFANDEKKKRYTEFMDEYLELGHMVEVHDKPEDCYFLPHHAVYKESSSSTKIRVVFDASAKTTSGLSLNDALGVGPTVQNDLITILLRFCCYPVVLTADIPKMYRQVQVHKDDRKYQRILWLNTNNEMATFERTTVTYGCASAPYLATSWMCGYLGPVTTTAKLLMQDLWRLKLNWDDELPNEQNELWTTFREQLPLVNALRKKRCVITSEATTLELHGFSDASQRAYGAVLYTRCISPNGTVSVELVCSKSSGSLEANDYSSSGIMRNTASGTFGGENDFGDENTFLESDTPH